MADLIKKLEKLHSTAQLENFFKSQDIEKLSELRDYLADVYYNTGENPISDEKYDVLVDFLKKQNIIVPVGAKLRTGDNRVKLPYWLGSADKITVNDPRDLQRWISKNPAKQYVISEKLDGVSCLYTCENGKVSLYTRGDGEIGADISYLANYITSIPKNIGENIAVRGELIVKKSVFDSVYRNREVNGRVYRNARNMVAGLVGSKTARQGLQDIDFVTYEIVADSMYNPSQQLQKLHLLGFKIAKYIRVKDITMQNLKDVLLDFKKKSEYEIDGIIVQSDVEYTRNISDNPDYLFAFKMMLEDSIKQTRVKYIEWNTTKHGLLKPVAIVEPVILNDITINRVTAHNAKYIEENNLGSGSIINVVRSNDVIPYIVSVEKSTQPDFPDIEYTWDFNHVNILAVDKDEDTICVKTISDFFSNIGVKFVSEATVRKMYDNGLNNLLKIIAADKARLSKIEEFGEKSVDRIYTNIHEGLKKVRISKLLGASSVLGFGIGERKVDSLLKNIPDLFEIYKVKTDKQLYDIIVNIEGFSDKTASLIIPNIQYADLLLKKLSPYCDFSKSQNVSNEFKNKTFVLSGFRDAELSEKIIQRGGKIGSSISKNTSGLIVKKGTKITGKLSKAEELGIPIYTKEDFIEKFFSIQDKIEVKIFDRFWTLDDTKKYNDYLFVYGDNDIRQGKGGQAIIRGVDNSYGIRTKKYPDNKESSFYTDKEYSENCRKIDEDIDTIIKLVKQQGYKGIIISQDGVGTGLSQLQVKAPKTLDYINKRIKDIQN